MKEEVKSASDFLAMLLEKSGVETERASTFNEVLQTLVCKHYVNHWFPEKPFKGSAYRCLRINSNKMEPLINAAFTVSGITQSQILRSLPCELTLWIDPKEVSYRIGENGSVCVLYSENGNAEDSSYTGDTDSSPSSLESSPRSSPQISPSTSPTKSPIHIQLPVPNNRKTNRSYRNRSNFRYNKRNDNSDMNSSCNDNWFVSEPKIATYVYS